MTRGNGRATIPQTEATPEEEQTRKRVQAAILMETQQLARQFGISNPAAGTTGSLKRSEALKLLHYVVSAMYGIDRRIKEAMQATLRSAGFANMGWNLTNVIVKVYGDALVELGVWETTEEMESAFKAASKVLMDRASQNPDEDDAVDRVAQHIGGLVRENNQRIADGIARAQEEAQNEGQEEDEETEGTEQGNGGADRLGQEDGEGDQGGAETAGED